MSAAASRRGRRGGPRAAHDREPLPHLFRVLFPFWVQGRLDEARTLLDEPLEPEPGGSQHPARDPVPVRACPAGAAEGDPERAARLEGAADGLRERVGLPTWPHLRRPEATLVAKLRRRLGDSPFDQAFVAGSRLTQRQAVDLVRHRPDAGLQAP